jgi:hypothetical protein
MTVHSRKLKMITFTLDGNSFECQVEKWKLVNNTEDGEKRYAQCPDGEFREEAEPDYALELTFFADHRSDGISDYLTQHDQETVDFVLDHLYDIPGEHVRRAGQVKLKDPGMGGDARTTEMIEITLPCIGKPTYSRP